VIARTRAAKGAASLRDWSARFWDDLMPPALMQPLRGESKVEPAIRSSAPAIPLIPDFIMEGRVGIMIPRAYDASPGLRSLGRYTRWQSAWCRTPPRQRTISRGQAFCTC